MEEEFHNHMRIPWHDYTRKSIGRPITEASLSEKASIIGRTGILNILVLMVVTVIQNPYVCLIQA